MTPRQASAGRANIVDVLSDRPIAVKDLLPGIIRFSAIDKVTPDSSFRRSL